MDAGRLAELLAYCHLEEFAGDAAVERRVTRAYFAAVGYLETAGVAEPPENTPRRAVYDEVVDAMVLDAYDRRDVTFVGTSVVGNPAFQRKKNQLKLTEPVSESGT